MRKKNRRTKSSSSNGTATPNSKKLLDYAALLLAHEQSSAVGQPLLTERGESYLRERLPAKNAQTVQPGSLLASAAEKRDRPAPRWDSKDRKLWLGEWILREYEKQPAPYQTTLLDAFQREGWPLHSIADPLEREPGESDHDARQRLKWSIGNLNNALPPGTIRFRGDGTGQGVKWEYASRRSGKRTGRSGKK